MGSSGTGTLNVTDGGVVANIIGFIGSQSGYIDNIAIQSNFFRATGEATVTGTDSQWNNSGGGAGLLASYRRHRTNRRHRY